MFRFDLTGLTYGDWTVLSHAKQYNHRTFWNCICSCGTIKVVDGAALKGGKSKSCGCKGSRATIGARSHTFDHTKTHKDGIPTEVLFWRKVEKTESCWLWTANTIHFGYGGFAVKRKRVSAHRYSYMLHKGAIPENLVVRHICNNPICVNPDHLELGTQADNIHDAVKLNRHCHGETHGGAIITDALALEIKLDLAKGIFATRIAKKLGVNKYIVYDIKRGKTWKHISL